MNPPRRFKTAAKLDHEGRLMAVGGSEMPDAEAMHRVAQNLRVSAAALATAAVATTIAPSAAAATTTVSSSGIGTAATVKATGSLLTLSAVKATATGVGLGLALFAGAEWVRSGAPASTSPSLAVDSKMQNRVQASHRGPSAVPTGSVAEYPKPATLPRQTISASPSSAREATVTEDRAAIDGAPLSSAAPIGRFDDLEPPTTLTARNSNPKDSLSSQTPEAASTPGHQVVAAPAEPQLAREVASLDRARSTAHRGDASGALRELDGFERNSGYYALRKESMLVRIDVLLSLARRAEAAATARQLLLMGAPVNQRARLEALLREQH